MIVDFSTLPRPGKDRPTLILRNLDGVAIQTLGYAYGVNAELSHNDVSTLTFELPAYVNGVPTPHYSDVVGMRVVELVGCGRFLLVDPSETGDGLKKIKSCKAYSLEYELAKKDFFIEEGTYKFYDLTNPEDTVIGRILEIIPDWTLEYIDSDLIDKYRTFDSVSSKVYDFIKNTVQETFRCIFTFDTMNRKIRITSAVSEVPANQIFLSTNRLIKTIDINEDSDNIITSLDVNGAEGVSIRSVNPTGKNKIYNLDYFMNTTNFSQTTIDKWYAWQAACENRQTGYYNITMEYNIRLMELLTEQAALADMETEMTVLDNKKGVIIQGIAQNIKTQSDLDEVNAEISVKSSEISAQKAKIESIQSTINSLSGELQSINNELAMDAKDSSGEYVYFTAAELKNIKRYFLEDSLQDSSFVAAATSTYSNADLSSSVVNKVLTISNGSVVTTDITDAKKIYDFSGGSMTFDTIRGDVIKATLEINSTTKAFVLSAYLSKGTVGAASFETATLTLTGEATLSFNNLQENKFASFKLSVSTGRIYFTKNNTQYEQHQIEWELYEYGKQVLAEKSLPTYTFDVSCGNFISLDEFISFRNQLALGQRVYLKLDDEVLTPYVTKVNIDYESANNFSIEFSSSFTAADKEFALTKLLEESVSMGKTLDIKSGQYNQFVSSGASDVLKDYINSAMDVARNRLMSTGEQAFTIDDAGIRLRQWANKSAGTYEPEQLWMINNTIAMTRDNWNTAELAIGKIFDPNLISEDNPTGVDYGIVAKYIVGTILAGRSLIITNESGSFKVDSSGVYVDADKFLITHTKSGTSQEYTLGDLGDVKTAFEAITIDGGLNAETLKGVISAAEASMESSNGRVLFDSQGVWLMDTDDKRTATSAVWMSENGILLGNGTAGTIDDWSWQTAITADGIVAERIIAGTLAGMSITGGEIKIGDAESSGGVYPFSVDENGAVIARDITITGTGDIYNRNTAVLEGVDVWGSRFGVKRYSNPKDETSPREYLGAGYIQMATRFDDDSHESLFSLLFKNTNLSDDGTEVDYTSSHIQINTLKESNWFTETFRTCVLNKAGGTPITLSAKHFIGQGTAPVLYDYIFGDSEGEFVNTVLAGSTVSLLCNTFFVDNHIYGKELPVDGVKGQVFFKVDVNASTGWSRVDPYIYV